jgi:hypothetical protein
MPIGDKDKPQEYQQTGLGTLFSYIASVGKGGDAVYGATTFSYNGEETKAEVSLDGDKIFVKNFFANPTDEISDETYEQLGEMLDGKTLHIEHCVIDGAYMDRVNLAGAHIVNASFGGTIFNMTNLTGAYMEDVNLKNTEMPLADLTGAIIINSNLAGVNLKNSNLKNIKIDPDGIAGLPTYITKETNFEGANIEGFTIHGILVDQKAIKRYIKDFCE